MPKIVHAADFHLDSAFGGLPTEKARERRRESRELAFRLADYVNAHGVRLVLLAGDLFDSAAPYRETGEALAQALAAREPAVLDCMLDIDEMVRPMVAGGAHITDFLLK